MHPADLVEGLEDLQRASGNLVTDLDLNRDTLLEVNRTWPACQAPSWDLHL